VSKTKKSNVFNTILVIFLTERTAWRKEMSFLLAFKIDGIIGIGEALLFKDSIASRTLQEQRKSSKLQ